MNQSKKSCCICGLVDWKFRLETVRSCYAIHENHYICEPCGDKASSFVNYWNKKKQKDLDKLKKYLNSGVYAMTKYSRQMNAGY